MWEKLKWTFSRIWFELLAIISIFAIIFLTPSSYIASADARIGLLALFITKFLFVSAGTLHAHAIREILFPYINFNKEEGLTSNAVLVIAIYVIVIFAWARGG